MSETFKVQWHRPEHDKVFRASRGDASVTVITMPPVDVPVRFYWLLAHPMSGYYFGEES